MPDQEKEKEKSSPSVVPVELTQATGAPLPGVKPAAPGEDDAAQYFYGEALVGFDPSEITGNLIVIEGMDGSGRSTQIALVAGMARVGRFRRPDKRIAKIVSRGTRHRRTARKERRNAADAVADVRDGFF